MNTEDRLIWLNGKVMPLSQANLNVLSPSFQFGANVFEGIRAYWDSDKEQLYVFRLDDHYNRLLQSIRLFKMNNPYTVEDLKNAMLQVVRDSEYKCDIAIRQTVFVDGFGSWFSTEPIGMFVAPIAKSRKNNPIEKGERVCISSWERISERDMSPRVKVGANYINSRMAKIEASEKGYDSALFLNMEGFVSEGTGSCFFMIKNNTLVTPRLSDSILESITRDTVIQLAKNELNIEVVERRISRTELYTCDEAFFCGSAVEITPITEIDGYTIDGTLKKDSITNTIHKLYIDIATGKNSKYTEWLTPIYEE